MRRFLPAPRSLVIARALGVVALLALTTIPAAGQVIVGPNVNMGGGPATFDLATKKIVGDPFLQRQNEPSIAVSSRNPCHLLGGANDYRAVDVEDAAGEVGDAWLGVFKSFDCGATWTSTLMPGHKLDASPEGLASPLKGLAAAADATVRAGTNGLFYYSGIAFNRGDNTTGKVFVARFVDNNNKDGGDPIQYLGTVQIDTGTSGQFLDKPWIVADIPRGGSTCTINGRSVPAGPVYLVYTSFVGGDNNVRSKILFSKSTNCGATWSSPAKVSEGVAKNQGTTIAIDPGTGDIHLAWREFSSPSDSNSRNAIIVAQSTDGGKSFTKATALTPNGYQFQPFDQASSPLTFRTNAYPAIAVVPAEADGRAAGQPGRVYVAWSARGFGAVRPSDARIVYSSAIGGATWTSPRPTDSYQGAGHQIMPALAFAGGKMALAYYDLRDDASGGFEDLVMEYGQNAFDQCMISPGSSGPLGFTAVLMCVVENPSLSRRHTLDMRAAIVDAGPCLATGTCVWSESSLLGSSRVSRYVEGRGTASGRQQLQYNRPNLPIFSKGRFPFIGDYIDIAGQSFVTGANGGWAWNTGQTANRPAPVFHVAWADNRNVGTPRAAQGVAPDWSQYTPPVLGPNSVVCIPGLVGTRNQDVYTAQLRPGLVVSSPQNSKRITGLQRSFVVVAQNTTDSEHRYRLRAEPSAGVIASFDQFSGFGAGAPIAEIFVTIPRKSSASRTLFVGLLNPPANPADAPDVLVPVHVDELADDAPTGTFDQVFLNPDFENPDFENPDFENQELHNPDFENPDFENPDFENPDFENFTLSASSAIRNPDFENPDFENPDFENPDFENPDFENPDFENPDFENPDFENPDFENPDFQNGSFQVSDTTWPVRNNGNTTSAYKTNVFVQDPPDGVKFQLAIRKVFTGPAAVCTADGSVPLYAQSVPLVNIIGPDVQSNPFDRNFNDSSRDNATFFLAPGERGIITLRAYCATGVSGCTADLIASLQGQTALGVVAQGANCYAEEDGLGDSVGGTNRCVVADGPPKDIYDPIPPAIAVLSPTITTPETIVEATDGDNTGDESVTFSLLATDNVAIASVSCQAGPTAVAAAGVSADTYQFTGSFPVGTTGVTCTALDVRGTPAPNSASVSFAVRVKDVTAPSFNVAAGPDAGAPYGPGNPAEATGADGAVVTYTTPTATDSNGGPVTVVCASPGGLVSGSTFPVGVTDINCVATDESGVATPPANLFDITVADTTAPSVVLAGDAQMTIEAGTTYVEPGASATDLVSGTLATTTSGAVNPLVPGTYTLTYSATDAAGNLGSASRVVVVADRTAPVFGPAANVTAEATSAAGADVNYAAPSAADSFDPSLSIACVQPSGSLFPLGTTTVSCTATDDSGNAATTSFTVTVRDTIAPALTVPASVSAEATSATGAIVAYSATATDAVDPAPVVTCAPASGATFAAGAITVSCVATDATGNASAAKTFTVTVGDHTAPALTVPADVIAEATSAAGATVTYSATATDAVDPAPGVTCAPASGATFAAGATTVSCVATDAAGNASAARTFTITVRDTSAPALTVPANVSAEATSAAGATVTYSATAADAVDPAPVVTCTPASGATFAAGATTVSCVATDASRNASAAKTFTVTVRDSIAPALAVPANMTAEATGAAGAVVAYSATATDAVDPAPVVTCAPASGATFAVGTTTVSCAAKDATGNASAAKTFTITVRDTVAPVLTVPANISGIVATGPAGAVVTYAATATDAVDPAPVVTCAPASGATFPVGTTTVSCVAKDATGNASAAKTFTVTVIAPPPTVTATATPSTLLWSPNKTMTPVTVSGKITASSLKDASYKVVDEYGKVQPSGKITVSSNGDYSFVVKLEAYRNGTDTNGRIYTITVTATDTSNRTASAQAIVTVPHNQ